MLTFCVVQKSIMGYCLPTRVPTASYKFYNFYTRQLSIGAGHCPWGGYTDQNVCNIHGEVQRFYLFRAVT